MDIAKRIMQLCEERNLSIYKLAEISDLTQSTVQNIVSGRNASMLVSTLEKICAGLGVTMADFFTEEKPKFPPEAAKEISEFEKYIISKYNLKPGN